MLLSVLLVPHIKKFSPINIKNLTLSFKSALLSFYQQLEAGLGLGTCGWGSGNVVSVCFFLSDPPITGWWFRSLRAQRTKSFREASVVIRGWWQTFRCWLFVSWGPSVGFFHGGMFPPMGSLGWQATLPSQVLLPTAHCGPGPAWGNRSTLPTGRLAGDVCLASSWKRVWSKYLLL